MSNCPTSASVLSPLGAVIGFVVSDVRFENEAALIRQRGGTLIHISRDNAQVVNPHISEVGVIVHKDDLILRNNGTLEQFLNSVDEVFLTIRERHQRSEQLSA